jgi:hypothetical protein
MVALAMGKMGAGELNYSSDIDLICLFDQDRYPGEDAGGPRLLHPGHPPDDRAPVGHRPTAMSSAATCGCVPMPA